jgi:hypothetical protein
MQFMLRLEPYQEQSLLVLLQVAASPQLSDVQPRPQSRPDIAGVSVDVLKVDGERDVRVEGSAKTR